MFFSTNMLLFDLLTILIHYFLLFFSILSEKEKFYVKKKKNTQSSCMIFFFVRFVIYPSGIIMNISNTWSVTVLSNLQFNLTFSVKKSCKNESICPPNICLSDIITTSSISLIVLSIEDFLSHKKIEIYPSIHFIWWNQKKVHYFE